MNFAKAIVATLAYHDIFNYPLKKEEVYYYLIDKKTYLSQIEKELLRLIKNSKIEKEHGFYFLKNRPQIVNTRRQRGRYSQQKLKIAARYAATLKAIPTIKMVAISGALALDNSHKNDDIDFMLVTSAGMIWTTRLLANLLLWPFKRDPKGESISNMACLNLFLDESNLEIKNKNLYTAHEICQLEPIWDRDDTYQKFIKVNSWTKKYLPNWQAKKLTSKWKIVNKQKKSILSYLPFIMNHLPIENLLKSIQLRYMSKKITTEKIWEGQLFFHPSDTQKWVLSQYQKRCKRFKF